MPEPWPRPAAPFCLGSVAVALAACGHKLLLVTSLLSGSARTPASLGFSSPICKVRVLDWIVLRSVPALPPPGCEPPEVGDAAGLLGMLGACRGGEGPGGR